MYDPFLHQRRSIRRDGYDYGAEGAYFVTICVQDHRHLFGEVAEGRMRINAAGEMIEAWFREIERKFPAHACDAFICMPNHVHFIVINHAPSGEEAEFPEELGYRSGIEPTDHTDPPLPAIVQWFKTMTTNSYIRGVKNGMWPPFRKRLWQRNYYEHIVRNLADHDRIRAYIRDNPQNWHDDDLTPWIPEP